ncbi:MAG: hypothetical protein IJM56_00415, partial [Clostridia bacterium]|nr:hypothetical protein [Clostridia bacterium]
GLAGINDVGVNYDEIYFAPKFPVTPYTELRYLTGYEVSGALVDVRYILMEQGMRYDILSPARKISAHILLPKGRTFSKLTLNGQETAFALQRIGESVYADFEVQAEGKASIVFE